MRHLKKTKWQLSHILRIEVFITVLSALLLVYILFMKPFVGLADNGDFYRIMHPMKLYYLPDNSYSQYFGHFNRLYGITRYNVENPQNFISSQVLLTKAAIFINKIFYKGYLFDIRFLAFIYSCVFLYSEYIILKHNMPETKMLKVFLGSLSIFIFTDAGYIAYFNSFYGEPASYVFFLMSLAFLSQLFFRRRPGTFTLLLYTVSGSLFISAKQQNSPMGVLFAGVNLIYLRTRKDIKWKTAVIISAIVFLIISGIVFATISPEIKRINQYHTIALGILKDSPDPGKDLEELGIDHKFSLLKGTSYYDPYPVIVPDSPIMIKEFYSKYSFSKIVLFYVRHTGRLLDRMEAAAANAFYIKPASLGNYESSEGYEFGRTTNTFSLWSTFKVQLMPHTLRFVVFFFLIFIIGSSVIYILNKAMKLRKQIELLWLVALIGIAQFITSFIGAGEADLAKHLLLFNVCFDIIFSAMFTYISKPIFILLLKFIRH